MNKINLCIVALIATLGLKAQSFQGVAVYESKTSTSDMTAGFQGNREITPEMRKRWEERMKNMFEKTFVLNFDQNASIYVEQEKLEQPGQEGGFRMGSMMGGGGTHYKNIKEKIFTVDREFFGKEFLVKDSLPKLEWKLEGESKQIGNYMCYKATAIRPVESSDFRNFRRKKEDVDAEKKQDSIKKSTQTTNFMDQWEMPSEIKITAWYAPEIPISQGPENYHGLPGLILEISDGKTTILCSKVVLNTKEKKDIKAPKKGKLVSQAEYDKIVKEKMEEMREMGRSGRGFRMGG
jgi:GLPGLI family protein